MRSLAPITIRDEHWVGLPEPVWAKCQAGMQAGMGHAIICRPQAHTSVNLQQCNVANVTMTCSVLLVSKISLKSVQQLVMV